MVKQITEKYDVIVIGGGIAGLSTAANIIKGNVLLIERDKIKTEEERYLRVTYSGWPEQYGLKETVINTFNILRFQSNRILEVPYPKEDLLLIDLGKINNLLKNYVKKKHECWENTSARTLKITNNTIDIDVMRNNEITTLSTKYLVDATGANFLTRKIFNLHIPHIFLHYLSATFNGGYVQDKKVFTCLLPSSEVNTLGSIYPYSTKNYNYGIGKIYSNTKYQVEELKARFFKTKSHPINNNKIQSGSKKDWDAGILPFGASDSLVFKRICYVGDAAFQPTPWGCEGVRPAIQASVMCGDALNSALEHDDKILLKKYENNWKATYGDQYRKTNYNARWIRTIEEWNKSIDRMKLLLKNGLDFFHSCLKYQNMSKDKQRFIEELVPNWM